MKLNQLTIPDTVVATPIEEYAPPPVLTSSEEYEEEEYVMKHALSSDANARMKRQLKLLKTADPALYDKIVNHR
jgi:hypothetical protein